MRPLTILSRYLITGIVAAIAIAAGIAAVLQARIPGGADRITLSLLVIICVFAAIAAALTFRQAGTTSALAKAGRTIAAAEGNGNAPALDDDLDQLTESLHFINSRLREGKVSRLQLDVVLAALNDAIIQTDADGNIAYLNPAAIALLGREAADVIGTPTIDLVATQYHSGFKLTNQNKTREAALVTADEREVPVSYSCSQIDADAFATKGFIIAARNISERKLTERRIRYLAKIDALTKIPNRMQFQHLLQQLNARAQRNRNHVALLYFDIDRFKDINDTYGHAAGDTCLETLARRLTKILPKNAISGRLAGDEFAVALEWPRPKDELNAYLQSFARKLADELGQLVIIQGHEIHVGISIGIATLPRDADNVIDLIRNADAALYHAKRTPQSTFEFFDAQMNAESVERLMLKSKLRRSYELDELLVHYQPKIDVKTGAISGCEALVRWELTDRGIVLPNEFIPLAEETNLIVEIGEWVLNQVCRDLSDWQQRIPGTGKVSVNLSLKQLAQPNFTKRIRRILKRHAVSPRALELEITETTLMRDPDHTIRILRQLDDMGLNLSIDDFGTGYSSLSAMQQFPISTLKIDKSFIHELLIKKDGTTIVSAIIDLAHSMNMEVVAEGVESELQLSYLKVLDCDLVQGLLFGEPMAAADYFKLLLTDSRGRASYRELFA
ncbi:MAG: putative bifunctional diguanylate cyclase/phosphodiesterase [Gammaproteobacteria bacterium]